MSAGRLVVAVAVALVALETRDQDERALHADHADHVAKHVLAAPLVERLVQALGEAVVGDRREVLLVDAVIAVGDRQLLGADQPEAVEELRTEALSPDSPRLSVSSATRAPVPRLDQRQHARRAHRRDGAGW